MTTRAARRAALVTLGVFVASISPAAMLAARNGNLSADNASVVLAFAAYMVVGALVVARRPENPIGWLFSAVGLLVATGWLAQEYAEYAYVTSPGSLPAGIWPPGMEAGTGSLCSGACWCSRCCCFPPDAHHLRAGSPFCGSRAWR